MSDYFAARQNDALVHTSMFAEITSLLVEGAAYAAAGAAVAAAAAVTAPLAGAGALAAGLAAVGSGCVLSGIIGGLLANLAGVTGDISRAADGIGSFLFPPRPCGRITSGSPDVFINGLPAARAAGKPRPSGSPQAVVQQPQDFFDYGAALLGAAGQTLSGFWRPVEAEAEAADPAHQDTIGCDRHRGPDWLAEGSDSVFINGQPAVRSGDRTTCGATVAAGASPDVIIGGRARVVRQIRSGTTPWLLPAAMLLPLMRGRPGAVLKNLPCMLYRAGGGMAADLLINAAFASPDPVHAASGAKVLNGDDDLDFVLPGRLPLRWQRCYNSRSRTAGIFGRGWMTAFDSRIELRGDDALWLDETGRGLRFTLPPPDEPLFSRGDGLIFRAGPGGALAVADDGGLWRLYRPLRGNPARLRLASLSDEYGNRLECEYDDDERPVRIRDEPGAVNLTLHYDSPDFPARVTALSHHDGGRRWPLVRYGYDAGGRLASVTDAAGVATRGFRYDGAGLMVWQRLPGGRECEYRWRRHDHWRVVAARSSGGAACEISYDLPAGLTTVTGGDGAVRRHRWDRQQQVTRYTDARGESWLFTRDDDGLLTRLIDPAGHATLYRYDDAGNLVEEEDPAGHVRATEWLAHRALPASITDADGGVTRLAYDAHHGLAAVTDACGQTTRLERDEYGQVVAVTDANGGISRRDYDDAGQLTRATDCTGSSTRWRYHSRGWLQAEMLADGEETRMEYDAAGRPLRVSRAEGWQESREYDARGLLKTLTDATGKRHHFRHDACGRLVATRNPEGGEVRREYDAQGRLAALVNENGARHLFRWRPGGLPESETAPDGVTTAYRHDAAGRLVSRALSAEGAAPLAEEYEYDARGLLAARHTADGVTRFEHSPGGRLLRAVTHPHGGGPQALGLEYDRCGRTVAECGENGRVEYAHDAAGSRTAVTLPDGRRLKNLYYGGGHLLGIALDGLAISDFRRDPLHREVSRSQGALTSRTAYDRHGRLRSRELFRGGQVRPAPRQWSRSWQYDNAHRPVREEHDDNPHAWRSWQYDGAGRLLAQGGGLADHERWRWDAASNPVDSGAGAVAGNRVTQLNGVRWRYDAYGRVAEKVSGRERWRYRYDGEQRLAEVVHDTRDDRGLRLHVGFRYDPLGRRVSKTRWRQDASGEVCGEPQTTRFVWEGLRLLQEIEDGVPLTYVWAGPGSYEPLARIDGAENPAVYWYHCRPDGTPEALTDEAGAVRWRAGNGAWGKLLRETRQDAPDFAQSLRMQGQYLDRETGLHYNLFRYYDPDCARFTQPDPIGLAGGLNLYQYAPNPLSWIDPLGLTGWQIDGDRTTAILQGGPFKEKYYRDGQTGLWWSKDTTGHGGSAYKVFRETSTSLEWIADADKHGQFIPDKHKGNTGKSIPKKSCNSITIK